MEGLKILTKKELKELLDAVGDSQKAMVFSDDKWIYPPLLPIRLRDEGNSVMLRAMFRIENKPGVLVYLPRVTYEILQEGIKEDKKVEEKPKKKTRKRK